MDLNKLQRICEELSQRGIPATLFVTPFSGKQYEEKLHQLYLSGLEIPLLSPYLGGMSRRIQSLEISEGLRKVSGCPMCKTDQPVVGIRPTRFVQNEDTYQLVDSLQFAYNAGFQARLLYMPGHGQEFGPYHAEGYDFAAVPVSTTLWQGERVCLSDRIFGQLAGVDPDQWGELLGVFNT